MRNRFTPQTSLLLGKIMQKHDKKLYSTCIISDGRVVFFLFVFASAMEVKNSFLVCFENPSILSLTPNNLFFYRTKFYVIITF
jgi:hypothetical protein